jgi:hypothetical protein
VELAVHLADEPARAFQAARRQIGRPVLSLRTADCHSEAERLKAKGVVFVMEPTKMPHGGTDAVFYDTCGNLLDLHQDRTAQPPRATGARPAPAIAVSHQSGRRDDVGP